MLYTIIVAEIEDGQWFLQVLDLPGCHTQADSLTQGIPYIKEAISLYLETIDPSKTVGVEDIALVVVRGKYIPSDADREEAEDIADVREQDRLLREGKTKLIPWSEVHDELLKRADEEDSAESD